jgi:hypothetical protein
VDITTNNNSSNPYGLLAGQKITLSVTGAPPGTDIVWAPPPFPTVVKDFSPEGQKPTTGGPVHFGDGEAVDSQRTLAFTCGGDASLAAVVYVFSPACGRLIPFDLGAYFHVLAPNITAIATLTDVVVKPYYEGARVGPVMSIANVNAPAGWEYQWVQVLTKWQWNIKRKGGGDFEDFEGCALDTGYPAPRAGKFFSDIPGLTFTRMDTGGSFDFAAKTWLMAKPTKDLQGNDVKGIFVPVCSLEWSTSFSFIVSSSEASNPKTFPRGKTNLAPDMRYPQWNGFFEAE